MSIKVATAKPKWSGFALVRDKEGRPKFDDPTKIKLFKDHLTEGDKAYLVNLFNVHEFDDFMKE